MLIELCILSVSLGLPWVRSNLAFRDWTIKLSLKMPSHLCCIILNILAQLKEIYIEYVTDNNFKKLDKELGFIIIQGV